MSSLFIGLGGFGTRTLDFLSEKMDAYNRDLANQGIPAVVADYYYIDTDSNRYNRDPQDFLPSSNKYFHHIGRLSPNIIVDGMRRGGGTQYDLLNKWYDAYSKSETMNVGSDIVRQFARLGFVAEAPAIRQELIPLIQKVTQQNGRIYVITSSCGGTGSGIYMDLLYMISEIYECMSTSAMSTDVRLVMAMPEGYISNVSPLDFANMKMRLNAFATLEELNAICKDKYSMPSKFNGCYVGPYKKTGPFQPFRFGYLYDTVHKSICESCKDLSDFLFELEFAGDTNNCAAEGYNGSYFDGLLTGTVDGNWNNSINDEYVKAFNAIGRYSIEKPDFLYKKYFSDRLLFDVFHEGLLGENKSVDEDLVRDLATRFMADCDCRIHQACDNILANYLTHDIFDNDLKAAEMFSVLTQYPNKGLPEVKKVLAAKDILLCEIRVWVYSQCKQWLCRYDLATVYAVLERLDVDTYAYALSINQDYAEMLDKAKEASKGGFLRRHIQPERAMEQFRQMLSVWLKFEVSKALSSGLDGDIDVQNHGYFDYCKRFVEIAMHNLCLNKEQEHWVEHFIKEVGTLKFKENTSFIPDLNTFVNNQCNIVPDSLMVMTYDRVVINNPSHADFTQGTCTPATLHEKIMDEMKNNEDDCNLDELFDPTPGKARGLYDHSNSMLFVERYVAAAKRQIDILLEANESYRSLFAGDVLTRLQSLPQLERGKICMKYAVYDKVQMKTVYTIPDVVSTFTYHIISNASNTPLMQALGILDQNGNRKIDSDVSASNPFYADKIVKLIVKTGYKIDDYRYFEAYKEFAERELKVDCRFDSFIDKRFLGVPDKNGNYPCDVSAALEKIEQAKTYSLNGFNDVEIYKYCLALLYEYYDALKQGGQIESDFENAISYTANTTTIDIRRFVYDKLRMKYTLEESQTIDLASLSSTNNMEDLTIWIGYVLSKKKFIDNEYELYCKALEDFKLTLSSNLEEAIGNMMGDGNKPDYDFFNAYLDWYRKI